jgi:hypothetical protein
MKILIAILLAATLLTGCKYIEQFRDKPQVELPRPPAGASNTFLWKPISDKGSLVVLVPYSLSQHPVGSVTANGEKLNYTGIHNGDRAHYRSPKKGEAFGNKVNVVLTRGKDKWEWTVPNGGSRYEKGFNP